MNVYYVYQLRVEGEGNPFYIGKGIGDRAYYHLKPISLNSKENLHKTNTILKAKREGKDVLVEFLHINLTEQEAYDLERDIVLKYGRRNNGTGILTNLTDGGYGPLGYRHTDATKMRIKENARLFIINHPNRFRKNCSDGGTKACEVMWNGPLRDENVKRASEQMKERHKNGFTTILVEGNKKWASENLEGLKARNAKIAEKMNSEENRRKTSERVKELFKNEEYRKAVFPPLHISPRYLKKNAEDYQARLSVCICMGKLYDFWVENGKRTISYYENPNSIGFNYDNKLLINPIKNFQKGYNPNECEEYQEWIKDKEIDALWSDLGVYNKRGPDWGK